MSSQNLDCLVGMNFDDIEIPSSDETETTESSDEIDTQRGCDSMKVNGFEHSKHEYNYQSSFDNVPNRAINFDRLKEFFDDDDVTRERIEWCERYFNRR